MADNTVSQSQYMALLAERNDLANQLHVAKKENWLSSNLGIRENLAFMQVAAELMKAHKANGPFHSMHEGIAILREEYIELEQEIFKKAHLVDRSKVRLESMQVAAMGIRMMVDCAA